MFGTDYVVKSCNCYSRLYAVKHFQIGVVLLPLLSVEKMQRTKCVINLRITFMVFFIYLIRVPFAFVFRDNECPCGWRQC